MAAVNVLSGSDQVRNRLIEQRNVQPKKPSLGKHKLQPEKACAELQGVVTVNDLLNGLFTKADIGWVANTKGKMYRRIRYDKNLYFG